MNEIKGRLHIFMVFTLLNLMIMVILIVVGEVKDINSLISLTVLLLACGLLSILAIGEYIKLRNARLIKENPILKICNARISDISCEAAQARDIEIDEVIISYFGILLGSRIIKFNQKGIQLKDVEIGQDFISLTYGKDDRLENTMLLRPIIDTKTLDEITEKFSYETGIRPKVIF